MGTKTATLMVSSWAPRYIRSPGSSGIIKTENVQLSPGATAWSACSRRQLSRFISEYGDCLDNVPLVQSEWRHHHHRLPGQRFDGEEQCHLMYGPRWRLYKKGIINGDPVNICRAIWCRNHINLKSPNAAALQVSFSSPDSPSELTERNVAAGNRMF